MIAWGERGEEGRRGEQSGPCAAAGRPRRGQTHCFTHGRKSGL